MARRCATPPKSVPVAGHWRDAGPRKKKRKRGPVKPKAGATYYVAEASNGRTCAHHHRTRSGARSCANSHQRKETVSRARYLTRKQAKKTRVVRWDVTAKKA